MDNDIGGIELALTEIAFGPLEYASAAISPPQFDGAMRHLLLRKQRMGKAALDAGDCGHLAFTLTFTPDNAAVDAAGAKVAAAKAAAAAAAARVAELEARAAGGGGGGGGGGGAEEDEEEALLPNKYQAPRDLNTTGRLVVRITGTP